MGPYRHLIFVNSFYQTYHLKKKYYLLKEMTEFSKLELIISREGIKINGKDYKPNIQFDNNEIIVCDETKENAYGSHEYLSMMKSASNVAFTRKFNEYSKKYSIKSERVK